MSFNSVTFITFLGAVLALYHALPWRYGRFVLLAGSYLFYGAANPWYCFLILTSTLVDYAAARLIAEADRTHRKKMYLAASVVVNLALLGFFKYGNFFVHNANPFLKMFGMPLLPGLDLVLPVGISFYTFQTMSYTIDVYRGRFRPTRDIVSFSLYVAYFPQLVAGPIERAHRLLPQLQAKQKVTLEDLSSGFERMLWGFFKKLVIADRLAVLVDGAWKSPEQASGALAALAIVGFSFQLYLDFSAYTDIAIGVSRMMGVRLSENFRWPYLARNPSEMWSHWHMTLTSWFRDYVFEPLGGLMRNRPLRSLVNTVFVMTLMGLWHGASWNFVVFGFVGGLGLAAHQYFRIFAPRKKKGRLLGQGPGGVLSGLILNFLYINLIALFFRAPNVSEALTMLGRLFRFKEGWEPQYFFYAVLIGGLMATQFLKGLYYPRREPVMMNPPLRGFLWLCLFLGVVFFSVDTAEKFIYFQF